MEDLFSRTLQGSELKHASIEREAQVIIEVALEILPYFILKPDQKSVSYMFDKHYTGKIKNEKFLRQRLELSCFSFDIIYRPGRDNVPADTLSRLRAPWPPKIPSSSFTRLSAIQESSDLTTLCKPRTYLIPSMRFRR